MSRPSAPPALRSSSFGSVLSAARSEYEALLRPLQAIAFWAAVVMPFVYLPLFVTGIETASEGIALAGLIGLHVVALVVGRRYRADD